MDWTTQEIEAALMRSLETMEGSNDYTPGPWTVTTKLLSDPMTVIYIAADNEYYERPFTLEAMEDGTPNAILGERRRVESHTVWLPVMEAQAAFSFSGEPFNARKTWKGLIFRAGDYPDKGVQVTAEQIKEIAANFKQPVPVMSEHQDSLIGRAMQADGAMLVKVWAEKDGAELHGEIESPGWLDYALRSIKKSVSVGLDWSCKALREISLTFKPRVTDAAVFASAALEFKQSPQFQEFRSRKPQAAVAIEALAAKASNPAPASRAGQGENHTMHEKFKALWSKLTPEQRAESGLTDADINNPLNFAQPKAPEIDPAIKAQLVALENANVTAEANTEFTALLNARKVTAAMKPGFVAGFRAALKDDGEGTVKFSATGEAQRGEAVKAFLAMFGELQPQFNVGERIPAGDFTEKPQEGSELDTFSKAAKQTASVGGNSK